MADSFPRLRSLNHQGAGASELGLLLWRGVERRRFEIRFDRGLVGYPADLHRLESSRREHLAPFGDALEVYGHLEDLLPPGSERALSVKCVQDKDTPAGGHHAEDFARGSLEIGPVESRIHAQEQREEIFLPGNLVGGS